MNLHADFNFSVNHGLIICLITDVQCTYSRTLKETSDPYITLNKLTSTSCG